MSAKQRQREAFAAKRARALTMMLLTRHENLLIEEVKEGIGLDYIVRFRTHDKEGLREFGIALRAAWTAVTKETADQVLRPILRQLKRYGPFPQPVYLFYFTMQDDGAWYTWLTEPAIEDGKPVLHSDCEADCRPLSKSAVTEILERVDCWYEALFARLIGNGPARSPSTGPSFGTRT